MSFDEEDLRDFKIEAQEMLDDGERRLLMVDRGSDFAQHYDAIFRVFHSLKGGAGMLGLTELQSHMHILEGIFTKYKSLSAVPKDNITMLLEAIDAARKKLNGESIAFVFADEANNINPVDGAHKAGSTEVEVLKNEVTKSIIPDSTGTQKNLIYAIDDEPDIISLIKEELEFMGYECETFLTAPPLFEAVKKRPPDLVLTDMKMPNVSGVDVLREVKKIDPDLPVIFVSGFLDKDVLIKSLELGVFSAIEKPFDDKTLLSHVKQAVQQRVLLRFFNKSINLVLYQFSDLDLFLAEHGRDDVRKTLRAELEQLVNYRRTLRNKQ